MNAESGPKDRVLSEPVNWRQRVGPLDPVRRQRCWLGPVLPGLLTIGLLGGGCRGVPGASELKARAELQRVQALWEGQPAGTAPVLPASPASLEELLRFALRNHPAVRAAYHDWVASVERITIERSLPDPWLSFEADIADVVMTVMPGLMQEFPGPGKRRAAAAMAGAESQARFHAFEQAVLKTAYEVKRVHAELWGAEERLRILRQSYEVLMGLEAAARAQHAVGRIPLPAVYRAQMEQQRLQTEIQNAEESRRALRAQWKSALGLGPEAPDPPLPASWKATPLELDAETLLQNALERNPLLRQMAAEIRMAEAQLVLASRSGLPDFTLGGMADLKAAPVMFRPLAGMSLPIWRDKIAAQIARARAQKAAAEARWSAEQIRLAAEVALKSFEYRQWTRNLRLIGDELLPKVQQMRETARALYGAGQGDFAELLEAERTWLDLRLQEVEARSRRETVLAELSLVMAGFVPAAVVEWWSTGVEAGVGERAAVALESGAVRTPWETSGSLSEEILAP